jgi:hypothetical protein
MRRTATSEWLAERKREAALIDPETAHVICKHRPVLDPYGVRDLSDEEMCIGRVYFARRPGGEVWVADEDLPEEVWRRLWERIEAGDPALNPPRPDDDGLPF